MDVKQAKAILERYRTGNCSPEEKQMVEQWYAQLVETGEWQWGEGEKEQLEQMMEARLLQQIGAQVKRPVHRIYFLKTARWWAAASIILLLGAGAYFMFFNKTEKNNLASLSQQERFKNDIAPAKQQVLLTLSDGSTKVLDTVSNGTVTLQGATQAVKTEGSIAYLKNKSTEVVFNTILTEKGRTFHLRLADGSDVWLDALSSIRFPTSFPGAERVVEVTGQVYFEVAKNQKQPFRVKSGSQVIEVLGTHFNVNTYNQQDIQTTLLEGSVKVFSHNSTQAIKPGQQAKVDNNGVIKVANDIDIDEVMAWKNGRFQFNGSSVEDIMNELSRWYNIDVVYKDKITETFVADIKRDLPVSKLLALLEMTKQIKFVIEGNKVTVMRW